MKIRHKFVDLIPNDLEQGVLYISLKYNVAIHKCACGCGKEVVTPLSPTDWRIIYNGSVSLEPSIGNWSFKCKSHYWIINNEIHWASQWTDEQIERNRERDIEKKKKYYAEKENVVIKLIKRIFKL